MNGFAKIVAVYLEDGSPLNLQAIRLASVPCIALGMLNPLEETAEAFGEKLSVKFFGY